MAEYTNRSEAAIVVKSLMDGKNNRSIHTENGGGFIVKRTPGVEAIREGDSLVVELHGASRIVGIRRPDTDEWLFRKCDLDIAQENEERDAAFDERRRVHLNANRDQWEAREDALPKWLRDRLALFHRNGGERFDLRGWSHELITCELAYAYVHSNLNDDDHVAQFALVNGTTETQHAFAKSLAQVYLEGVKDITAIPSAMTSITHDPYWLGAGVIQHAVAG